MALQCLCVGKKLVTADSHFLYHLETLTAWQFFGEKKIKKEEVKDKVLYWYLGLHCAEPLMYAEKKLHSSWLEIFINCKH